MNNIIFLNIYTYLKNRYIQINFKTDIIFESSYGF